MSRSGYSDDDGGEHYSIGLWRGAVKSAIRGKRGQALLREMVQALDALPEKCLAADSLVNEDGEYCTLGAIGRMRGMDMAPIDPDDRQQVARAFGVAEALAAEVMYLNDEWSAKEYRWIDIEICGPVRPHFPDWGRHKKSVRVDNPNVAEDRWSYMRKWATEHIKKSGEQG